MLNNDLFSDVKFVVRESDGESESKQVIPAHKFVLSIGSPVFEAMFYGELAETRDSIELPDCEYESLLELFRYMYSDEVNLSGNNVMRVFYLAKKYMVPSLADECTKYLQDNLDPSNVFSILPSAQKYEEKNLVARCWKMIDEQTEAAVKSDGFATIQRSLLEDIAVRDTLKIAEVELFKAVDLWATKECERQGLAANGEVKRRILGEKIVKEIRFPTMKQDEFASVVLDGDILTKQEIVSIIKRLNSVSSTPTRFSEIRRSGVRRNLQRVCRFMSFGYRYFHPIDVILFSVDKDVVLHGLRLFTGEGTQISHSIDIKVKDIASESVLVSKSGQFCSEELLQCEIGDYWGIEMLFNVGVVIKKNTTYCLEAKTTNPDIINAKYMCGTRVQSPVTSSGVTFTFVVSKLEINWGYGQFPELLFSVC